MLPIGDNIIAARARFRRNKQQQQQQQGSDWRNLFDPRTTTRGPSKYNHRQPAPCQNNGRLFSSKFAMSVAITIVILLAQLLIVHHYIGSNGAKLFQSPKWGLQDYADRHGWLCASLPYLADIVRLARRFEVQLVIVDPDLLGLLETAEAEKWRPVFSGPATGGGDKTIVHLAAVNETSGGQPNLKLFFNALKHNNYLLLKYDDDNGAIAPEVYRGPPNMFDDMLADAINDKQAVVKEILSTIDQKQDSTNNNRPLMLQGEDLEISKIYTEFMTHIFVLNDTSRRFGKETQSNCKQSRPTSGGAFVVISIVVMYNFEYDPGGRWLQPGLHLDEVDKHKLLSHRVHSKDFRVPMENYYLHSKRSIANVINAQGAKEQLTKYLEGYGVFQPNRFMSYVNNTYVQCKESSFNISGLIDNTRQVSNYLSLLDTGRPLSPGRLRDSVRNQLLVALQFMDVFSRSYGNFSFWLTGSSLLAYHRFCELALVPPGGQGDEGDPLEGRLLRADERGRRLDRVAINLELGMFAVELNSSMLGDLNEAKAIGVTMMSDWRRPNAIISFHVQDCPNLIFNIHPYDLKRDFHEYYYTTRHSMIKSRKFGQKKADKLMRRSNEQREGRAPFAGGHHVFTTSNLELCWTRVDGFHLFRVPCDVHDHLRRIYVI